MGFFDGAATAQRFEHGQIPRGGAQDAARDPAARPRRIATPRRNLPVGHPYRNAITGPPEDFRRIRLSDVLGFHRSWMTPDHATLLMIGDVKPEDAAALAERYLDRSCPQTLQIESNTRRRCG